MSLKATKRWLFGTALAGVVLLPACRHVSLALPPEKPIHPAVFSMIDSWLSDTAHPVVTEINLDAVDQNRNQFDASQVRKDGDLVIYEQPDTRSSMRYRIVEQANGRTTVDYFENGGGSLTTVRRIAFEITRREILVDGKRTSCRVLRVLSLSTR